MEKARGETTGGSSGDQGTPESLDKVRDILFGAQMRDSEKRFSNLEQRIQAEIANMREETRKRLDALETYITKELGSLAERLKSEQAERNESDKGLSAEQKDAAKALSAKIKELDDRSAASQSDLQKQILEQSKILRDEHQQGRQEMRAAVDRMVAELRTDKADRSVLAELFTDVAMRLSAEPKKAAGK